jgi:hypothetical protein
VFECRQFLRVGRPLLALTILGDSILRELNVGFEVFASAFDVVVPVRPLFRLADKALILCIGV